MPPYQNSLRVARFLRRAWQIVFQPEDAMRGDMAKPALPFRLSWPADWGTVSCLSITGLAFLVVFSQPMITLARDWCGDPDAGHGLLLFPVALYLAWRRGWVREPRGQPWLGLTMLVGAVTLRELSGLAAELFTMRCSMVLAAGALLVFARGYQQALHWWLPFVLLVLSIPLPAVLLNSLTFPLQLKASQLGAELLRSRHVPVVLAGNVIHLPRLSLFVTEACSGLRSLTALLALGVLVGGLWLRRAWARAVLVGAAVPVAIVLNGLRIFLAGFLVYFVSPRLGDGILHYTEGWVIFVVAFTVLSALAWALGGVERRWRWAA